jgi:hypothetical protein
LTWEGTGFNPEGSDVPPSFEDFSKEDLLYRYDEHGPIRFGEYFKLDREI